MKKLFYLALLAMAALTSCGQAGKSSITYGEGQEFYNDDPHVMPLVSMESAQLKMKLQNLAETQPSDTLVISVAQLKDAERIFRELCKPDIPVRITQEQGCRCMLWKQSDQNYIRLVCLDQMPDAHLLASMEICNEELKDLRRIIFVKAEG